MQNPSGNKTTHESTHPNLNAFAFSRVQKIFPCEIQQCQSILESIVHKLILWTVWEVPCITSAPRHLIVMGAISMLDKGLAVKARASGPIFFPFHYRPRCARAVFCINLLALTRLNSKLLAFGDSGVGSLLWQHHQHWRHYSRTQFPFKHHQHQQPYVQIVWQAGIENWSSPEGHYTPPHTHTHILTDSMKTLWTL